MRRTFTEEPRRELTEPEAIRRAQHGDAAAFEYLYKEHSKRVYSVCLRMLKNTPDAEDLTQQIFLRVFRKIGTFRGDSCFSTWLHRVAVNAVLMHLRRKRAPEIHPHSSNQAPANLDASNEFGTSDTSMLGAIERLNLMRAIRKLPAGYKRLFLLHDVMGYQHSEIATLVGCSIGCLKSQVHKARKRLQLLLYGEQGPAARDLGSVSVEGRDAAVTEIGPERYPDVTYRLSTTV
ncbi:MAG: RNA polymerase subunit sigma-24 [Acidobacteria bacterium]|nr:MAG: RNA polymerase subunit sigma-24 [Acidobacteriota bacterium]